ncbi:amino acid permease [Kitasatospora aureofaciens]|uniref:Transporter n=2 Tax=Kitasatospora aureofaciens TaxID=1894 RepID=A0A8H9HTA9_KITAU|nr:amino acid permease [Kitasatospora aureofaciens]ARF82176.1 transporter [Kitasatospora aureofaciens]GGU85023.1 transporter [Kitasatospora aureofaciens]
MNGRSTEHEQDHERRTTLMQTSPAATRQATRPSGPADPDPVTPDPAPAPGPAPAKGRRFGLATATALVMGNVIGGGIFMIPAAVAPFGTVSLLAFVVLTVGAIALALVFGQLARRNPRTGGPYVYAREAFGDFAGFLSAWSYWITTWVSNAALAVAAVGYLDVLVPIGHNRVLEITAALAFQWLPALANLAGTRFVGAVQLVSTVLKFIPLLLVSVGGLFFFDPKNIGPFDGNGQGWMGGMTAAAAILLFSYLGVESAAMSAGQVRDPERNVGRASVLGTSGAAVVYLLGTLAVFGTVAHQRLVTSSAPFSDAMNAMFGGTWGGTVIAVAALISMTGALNGWTLLAAQAPYAAARDGLFPAAFGKEKRGVPTFGVVVSVALASVLTVANFASGAKGAFDMLVLVTTFTAVVPYLLSTAAQLYWLVRGATDRVDGGHLVRDAVLGLGAFAFSLWLLAGAGYAAVYQGVLFLFAGILVYVWQAGRRRARPEGAAR